MSAESEHINTTPHLNRAKVKQTALEIARYRVDGYGEPRFKHISMAFLERIEAKTRAAIAEQIRIHPSKGKTLL